MRQRPLRPSHSYVLIIQSGSPGQLQFWTTYCKFMGQKIATLTSGRRTHFNASHGSRLPKSPTGVQSHSLSRSYRADLPTSLTCVIFSPKVTCLRDRMRLSVRKEFVTHQLPFMEYEIMHTTSYPAALLQCPLFWNWVLRKALCNYVGTMIPLR